jgi:hypothetical protein
MAYEKALVIRLARGSSQRKDGIEEARWDERKRFGNLLKRAITRTTPKPAPKAL